MPILNRLKNAIVPFLIALLFGLLAAFAGVMFFESAEKLVGGFLGLSAKNEILKFLGFGMGGTLLVIQAGISYRRAKAMEDAARAQAGATAEQAKANQSAEKGLRQERLKNAIEHLGHASDSVRLGGAYELFHLAEDTESLRQTVLDILCAHIRRTTGETEYQKNYKSKPSEEIQSLLTLLFVQEYEVFKGLDINLKGSWLKGTELFGAHLVYADLSNVLLHEASLSKSEMWWSNLFGAQLQGAHIVRAQMQGAFLYNTQLQGANLGFTQMQGVDLSDAQLQGTNLASVQLQGALLGGAQLQGAYLDKTQIQGANCEELVDMDKTRIVQSIGRASDLSYVTFEGGLSQEDVDSLVADLSDEAAKELREKLKPHIDKPESNELPENSGAITGTYTAEEAEQWLAEFEKVMGKTTGMGDS